MTISDLNFLAEITIGELAITHGGQTEVPIRSQLLIGRGGRTASLNLNVRNFLKNNNLASISNCDAIYTPDEENPGEGVVSFQCDAQERSAA